MKLPFLRKPATGDEPLVVSMSGARLGDTVLFAGRSTALLFPLAARTGLSGRTVVVGAPDVTSALEAAATRNGLLVEASDRFPADHLFELAVIEAVDDWPEASRAARDAVRSGGRIVIVIGSPRTGLLSRLAAKSPGPAPDAVTSTLTSQGWQRARAIGGRDGLLFVEAFG